MSTLLKGSLIKEASSLLATDVSEATASYIAQGEQRTAALLGEALTRAGIPSRVVEPYEIGLKTEGASLESAPVRVDARALEWLWQGFPVLVLPGFYGVDVRSLRKEREAHLHRRRQGAAKLRA